MRFLVAFELVADRHLQMSPFPDQLAELIALLPALQAMLADDVGAILLGQRVSLRPCLHRVREAVENRGNVIVELHSRKRRTGGAFGSGIVCRAPRFKNGIAPLEKGRSQRAQLRPNLRIRSLRLIRKRTCGGGGHRYNWNVCTKRSIGLEGRRNPLSTRGRAFW